jgi:nitrogen regulatory protein P-II 1
MKKLEAVISPSRLDKVRNCLIEKEIWEISVSEVSLYTLSAAPGSVRWSSFEISGSPERLKLELVINDAAAISVASMIGEVGSSSHFASAKVAILPVEEAVHIRTGERGLAALEPRSVRQLDDGKA